MSNLGLILVWGGLIRRIDRNIFVSKDKKTAWFDEIVVNELYGAMRGTGVLIYEKMNGKYHNTIYCCRYQTNICKNMQKK